MNIKFQNNQSHQQTAVQSVVKLFSSQKFRKPNLATAKFQGVANPIVSKQAIDFSSNIWKIQKENRITPSSVEQIKENGLNFTIEMETGTGKTYTYIQTIYELHKKLSFKKFIIVVPSIAIREGTLKNLSITHNHFQDEYGHPQGVVMNATVRTLTQKAALLNKYCLFLFLETKPQKN